MTTVNIHEAKTNFSKLVARVQAGEEIYIARAGQVVAKLTGCQSEPKKRKFGLWKGKVTLSPDFWGPVPGFEEYY